MPTPTASAGPAAAAAAGESEESPRQPSRLPARSPPDAHKSADEGGVPHRRRAQLRLPRHRLLHLEHECQRAQLPAGLQLGRRQGVGTFLTFSMWRGERRGTRLGLHEAVHPQMQLSRPAA